MMHRWHYTGKRVQQLLHKLRLTKGTVFNSKKKSTAKETPIQISYSPHEAAFHYEYSTICCYSTVLNCKQSPQLLDLKHLQSMR
jgi:hypothetical protein